MRLSLNLVEIVLHFVLAMLFVIVLGLLFVTFFVSVLDLLFACSSSWSWTWCSTCTSRRTHQAKRCVTADDAEQGGWSSAQCASRLTGSAVWTGDPEV